MLFGKFNEPWLKHLTSENMMHKNQALFDNMKKFLKNYESDFHLLPIPLVIDRLDFDEMAAATKVIMSAQHKIINYLLSTLSKKDILDYFDLPKESLPLINWDELASGDDLIARFDIVPSQDGYQFCEINAESSIGGLKLSDCYHTFQENLDFSNAIDRSPREDIADYIQQKVLEKGHSHVVIFTLHEYLTEGTGTVRALFDSVSKKVTRANVILAHEGNYPRELLNRSMGKKVLVYRLAMYDDVKCHELMLNIFNSGATIVNTFASEIRSNKKWFAILHDDNYRALLTQEECDTIDKFIPYTDYLTKESLSDVLENKNRYVFKKNRAYGGASVLIGEDESSDALKAKLQDPIHWTVQKLIECADLELPIDRDFNLAACKVVLGIFLINNISSGMLVRASYKSRIVSVATGGANIGWVLPTTIEERDRIAEHVEEVASSEKQNSKLSIV